MKYIKIETVYNRDNDGTKKLIEGDFRNETVKYLQNAMWEFTEKIDGTNVRIEWDGHRVTFGGHTDDSQMPTVLTNYLIATFGTNETEEMFEQKFGETPVTLYGEGYGAKIQKGGNYRSDISFILFDVLIGNIWLKRESVENIAKAFGVDVVPVVLRGNINDAVNFVKQHPKSTIGNAYMEGIVGRPTVELRDRMGKRVIVKIKYKDFC